MMSEIIGYIKVSKEELSKLAVAARKYLHGLYDKAVKDTTAEYDAYKKEKENISPLLRFVLGSDGYALSHNGWLRDRNTDWGQGREDAPNPEYVEYFIEVMLKGRMKVIETVINTCNSPEGDTTILLDIKTFNYIKRVASKYGKV